MENTLNVGEVERMIAEQVAARVELIVKSLAKEKAARKSQRKKESASLAGIVVDGDGKSVLSLKRSGVEIYCGEEGNTDVKVGVAVKRIKIEGTEREGVNEGGVVAKIGTEIELNSDIEEKAVGVSNVEREQVGANVSVGEFGNGVSGADVSLEGVGAGGMEGVGEVTIVEIADEDDDSSDDTSQSGDEVKAKKCNDSESSTSSSEAGSESSSSEDSTSDDYVPKDLVKKGLSSPKVASPSSRVLSGGMSVESPSKVRGGSVEKEEREGSVASSVPCTPLKMRATDASRAGREFQGIKKLTMSSKEEISRIGSFRGNELNQYDLFVPLGDEVIHLAKKKQQGSFNLYAVESKRGELYEMQIPLHVKVQEKLSTDLVGKGLRDKFLEAKVTVPSAVATLLALAPSFNAKQGGGLKLLGIVPTTFIMSANRNGMESLTKDYNVKEVFFVALNLHVDVNTIPVEWSQLHAGIKKPQKYGNGLSNVKKVEQIAALIFVSRYLGWLEYLEVVGKVDLEDHEDLKKGLYFLNKAMDDANVSQKLLKFDETKHVVRSAKIKTEEGEGLKGSVKYERNSKSEGSGSEETEIADVTEHIILEIQSARKNICGVLDGLEMKVYNLQTTVTKSVREMAKEAAIASLANMMKN